MELLPDDVLIIIFDFLSTAEKIRLSCVCLRLRNLFSSTTALHRNVSFKHSWCIPSEAICKYISQNSKFILRINLQDCYWLKQSQLIKCLNKCCKLISLDIHGCIISTANVMDLVKKLTKLQHLGCPFMIDSNTDMSSIFFGPFFKDLSSIHIVLHVSAPGLGALKIIHGLQDIQNVAVTIVSSNSSFHQEFYKYAVVDQSQLVVPHENRDPVVNRPFSSCLCNLKALKLSRSESFYMLEAHQSTCENDTYFKHSILSENLEELRISGFEFESEGEMSVIVGLLFGCRFLKHVSLTNVSLPQSLFLDGIQSSILETIDLESCYLLQLEMLEEIVERCQSSLKNLNLLIDNVLVYGRYKCKHYKTIRMITKCVGLQSLALNPCCLRTSTDEENQEDHQIPQDVEEPISNPLLTLASSTRFITEFELIEKIRTRATHCYEVDYREVACPCISSEQLESISYWKYLRKLTLAGFQVTGNSEFLITICQSCTKLSKLSLANLKGPALSHSGNIAHLNTALTFCHSLKDFRLEQPYFCITKTFLQALHNMHQLERVCWKVRSGTLAADHVAPWMNQCKKVICVIICCDITKKASKTLEKYLTDRYKSRRPTLIVAVYPYVMQKNDPIKRIADESRTPAIPSVHLQEMAFLSSRVGKSRDE